VPPPVSLCFLTILTTSVLPPLPAVRAAPVDEVALEERVVSALDRVAANIGILVDHPACRRAGSPLFPFLYTTRPQARVLKAMREMHYRAFPESLTFVAEHLVPMFKDPRGEEYSDFAEPFEGVRPDDETAAAAALVELSDASTRVRLAIVSLYLIDGHPVAKLFGAVLGALDPRRFEVAVFWLMDEHAPSRGAFLDLGADITVFDVSTLPLGQQRDRIATWRPHVSVFTSTGMSMATERIAMARLAPVQLLLHGHGATSGLRTVDAFLALGDANAVAGNSFTERRMVTLRSAGVAPIMPRRPRDPRTRADFGLPDEATLYVCVQNVIKVHPAVMDAWIEGILVRDANALIVFIHAPAKPAFGRALSERLHHSVPSRYTTSGGDRIRILPTVPEVQHGRGYNLLHHYLDLVLLADVVLDSYPFGGSTTTLECFAMGQPVVTLPGSELHGRITLKFYHHLGIFDTVARDSDDYVDIAVRMGMDVTLRRRLQRRVASRAGALFESAHVHDEYESMFWEAGRRAMELAARTLAGSR